MANKGVFFVGIFLFLGVLLVLFQGNGVKGLASHYLEEQGYVCEGDYCFQCAINNTLCICSTETCVCGSSTVDKKLCTVKLLWRQIPKD